MIQDTSGNSETGTPTAQVSSEVSRPQRAASEARSVLAQSQVSVRMDDTEDSRRDEQLSDHDDDDGGGDDEEIAEVLEIENDTEPDVRPSTSASTSFVSQTHISHICLVRIGYHVSKQL